MFKRFLTNHNDRFVFYLLLSFRKKKNKKKIKNKLNDISNTLTMSDDVTGHAG